MTEANAAPGWLIGGGEMGALIRAKDWSLTPLGPVEGWSQTLRMLVSFLIVNRFPLLLWWGPDFCQLYNDAYRPVLGTKHPKSLGQPVRECWAEIWHIIGPLIETPFNGGPATWMEDIPLELNRHGFVEETHFTIAYSPVPDESAPGGIGGVLATVHEITEKVVGERRVEILRDLGVRAGEGKTAEEACAIAAATLARHGTDVPFALIYLIEPDGAAAHLAGAAGVGPGAAVSPAHVRFEAGSSAWPLAEVVRRQETIIVEGLASRFEQVPAGPWSDPPSTAVLVPVRSNKPHELAGVLVAGASPRRPCDDRCRDFFELMAGQIATTIANARAYEEERRRAEALAEIDRAKTTFFSNVSHEFRTPLTLMLGPLEEALTAPADAPPRRDDLALVHRNGLRLLRLVNTLLDFSRIEAGRVQASYEPIDLATFTAELASVFRAATDKAGLRLIVDCPPLSEPVWVDRDMWEKIVLNLISNAFKFTLEGSIVVRVRQTAGAAEVSVQDTGTGIPAHELPRLFDRFHRVEGARGRTHEGTGIGLALVQELVKLHGGAVRVESAQGTGSTFTVAVPLGTAHLPADRLRAERRFVSTSVGARPYIEEALRWLPDASPEPEDVVDWGLRSLSDVPSARDDGRRATILLADDNADMRDYVRRLLSPRYEVRTVPDGAAALNAVRKQRPDLLLSDVMMPGLDGVALVRAVRGDPALADLPIVLLSARAGEEASVEGLDAGADDYLIKPFGARELLSRLASNLKMVELRRTVQEHTAADLQDMTRLHEVGTRCVRAGEDVGGCLADILDAAIAITRAQKGNIQLLDESSGELRIATQRGFAEPFLTFFARVDTDEAAACGAALQARERMVVEDVTQSPLFAGQQALEVLLDAGVRAVQSTPLLSTTGRVLGMISTHFDRPHRPSEREARLMDLLARQAADYLERRSGERRQRFLAAIVESSEAAIYSKSLDGLIQSWNVAAARMYGYSAEEIIGRPVSLLIPPERMADERDILERLARGERVERYETERQRRDGSRFEAQLTISPIRDETGRVVAASSITLDVTDRKRAERQQRFLADVTAALVGTLEVGGILDVLARLAVPTLADWCTIHLVGDDGRPRRVVTVHKDPAKATAVGVRDELHPSDSNAPYGVAQVLRTGRSVLYPDVEQALQTSSSAADRDVADFVRNLGFRSVIIAPLITHGRTLGTVTLATAESLRRYGDADVPVVEDIAHRAALAIDNARLHQAERDARREAERTAGRIARLQDFTAALSEAVTPQDVADATLRQAIEELGAGAGAVTVLDAPDEPPRTIGVRGYSLELAERWRREPRSVTALRDAIQTGDVVWFPSWAAFKARYLGAEPPTARVLHGARVAVPLMLRGRPVGVLYLNFAEERQFDSDEQQLLLMLGRQCAQALDRARLYAHEHRVAATLQQALLPTAMPQVSGIEIDAVYRAGAREADVGGDWYDALTLPDGRVMLTIGDVVGRGLGAAVTMGQMRQAVRAAALEGRPPADVLLLGSRLLRAAVAGQDMTTAILGVLDTVESTFTYATAGHPAPLLVVDGHATVLPSGGLPLGFLGESRAPQWTITLPPGSLLVLYTDGLTEAKRDPEAGLAALLSVAEEASGAGGSSAAHVIVDRLAVEPADDIAIVTVRLDPAPLDHLDLTVPAEPESLAVVRHALRRLVRAYGLDEVSAFGLTVSSGEAVSNAIEHAYGLTSGPVTVRAWRDAGVVRVEVSDEGRWREPVAGDRGGRGLRVMRALAQQVDVSPTHRGTRVSFTVPLRGVVSAHEQASAPGTTAVPSKALVPEVHRKIDADADPYTFAVRDVHGVPVVEVHGDIDLTSVGWFTRALDRAVARSNVPVVIAWSRPGYFDSHGVHVLLHAARRLETSRRALYLVVPPGWPLRRLLTEVGLNTVAHVCESTEEALALVRGDDPTVRDPA